MKVAVIGPGKKFTSGITYFTIALSNTLSSKYEVYALLLRDLLPRSMFSGKNRVGSKISDYDFNERVDVYDGIDWYLFPSMIGALRKLAGCDYIIIQWWTSSVAHTYFLIKAANAVFFRKKIILEFHESLDPYENENPLLRLYVRLITPLIFRGNYAYVAHSHHDKKILCEKYGLQVSRFHVVSHGSYDNFLMNMEEKKETTKCNILFFGLIRPYKGVEYLIDAYELLDKSKYNLTIAGEIWEGYDLTGKIPQGVRFIPRYLSDEEVAREFNNADVVVLPYTRASQSGVAHIAVSYGLPVIVTPVGGLVESMGQYDGALFVNPQDPVAIAGALNRIYPDRYKRYSNPCPWSRTFGQYEKILK
jgi:glycosyltransferase involved in cell wall biosynthesis